MKVNKPFIIADHIFNSRLLIGTGKYQTIDQLHSVLKESGSEIITVAVRRLNILETKSEKNLLNSINWKKMWLLPNTAGAKTADDAIRLAFLGRELAKRLGQVNNNFVKLEVISDSKYLFPDPIGTLKAADFLVKKGFIVLPYTSTDPVLARHLEDVGCSTIMPLGSPIGSGQGIQNSYNLQVIINNSKIPIIVDAGIGSPSQATYVMELGADGVLVNTSIAKSNTPQLMARAMNLAVKAGFEGYLAGIMNKSQFAQASSPLGDSSFFISN